MDVLDTQNRLRALGFDPGPIDGAPGRLTVAALRAFQSSRGLPPTGIAGPETRRALGLPPPADGPVWLAEARRREGLHEVRDRSALMQWLRADGASLGDPARHPWCGDFVQTAIALTLPEEPLPMNPYRALAWLGFGIALATPAPGAVLVFSRPGGGHVGFYVGERTDALRVLGGNQRNAAGEAWIAKDRCRGIRWPRTADRPRAGRVAVRAGGGLSTDEA